MTQSCPPQPQVSVIVPVYNQEQYLEECISSIRRQTLAEWECIIANSTFSWWAAWLNEHAEKIVIAPRIWFNREEGDRYHTDDALIPGSWLRI